jgi:hypothetical protein
MSHVNHGIGVVEVLLLIVVVSLVVGTLGATWGYDFALKQVGTRIEKCSVPLLPSSETGRS